MKTAWPRPGGFLQLAWIAALLLALAPSLSRWERSRDALDAVVAAPVCGGHLSQDRRAGQTRADSAHGPGHGDACGYCSLAALLLPGAVPWLSVPPSAIRSPLQVGPRLQERTGDRWRALGARGPPAPGV